MLLNAVLEPAKHAAQAEYLAERTANRFQIDKYEAWDFFSDVIPAAPTMGLVVESVPYLLAMFLLYILKKRDVLHA